jgi:hypothetical protein
VVLGAATFQCAFWQKESYFKRGRCGSDCGFRRGRALPYVRDIREGSFFERGERAASGYSRISSEVLQRNVAGIIVSQAMNDWPQVYFMRFWHPAGRFSGLNARRLSFSTR